MLYVLLLFTKPSTIYSSAFRLSDHWPHTNTYSLVSFSCSFIRIKANILISSLSRPLKLYASTITYLLFWITSAVQVYSITSPRQLQPNILSKTMLMAGRSLISPGIRWVISVMTGKISVGFEKSVMIYCFKLLWNTKTIPLYLMYMDRPTVEIDLLLTLNVVDFRSLVPLLLFPILPTGGHYAGDCLSYFLHFFSVVRHLDVNFQKGSCLQPLTCLELFTPTSRLSCFPKKLLF